MGIMVSSVACTTNMNAHARHSHLNRLRFGKDRGELLASAAPSAMDDDHDWFHVTLLCHFSNRLQVWRTRRGAD